MLDVQTAYELIQAEFPDIVSQDSSCWWIVADNERFEFVRYTFFGKTELRMVHKDLELYLRMPITFNYTSDTVLANENTLREYCEYVRKLSIQARAKRVRIAENAHINALLNAANAN